MKNKSPVQRNLGRGFLVKRQELLEVPDIPCEEQDFRLWMTALTKERWST